MVFYAQSAITVIIRARYNLGGKKSVRYTQYSSLNKQITEKEEKTVNVN